MAEGIFTRRAVRLWGIIGFLATRDRLTTGDQIAERFSVSRRTVYRDIDDIRSMGLDVEGEAGTGYVAGRDLVERWIDGMLYRNPASRRLTTSPNGYERRAAAAAVADAS